MAHAERSAIEKDRYNTIQLPQFTTTTTTIVNTITPSKHTNQVKSSIRLLCKCQRKTDYILIIAVTDAIMIYREGI